MKEGGTEEVAFSLPQLVSRTQGGGEIFFNSMRKMQSFGHLGSNWLVGGSEARDLTGLLSGRNGDPIAKYLEPWVRLPC